MFAVEGLAGRLAGAEDGLPDWPLVLVELFLTLLLVIDVLRLFPDVLPMILIGPFLKEFNMFFELDAPPWLLLTSEEEPVSPLLLCEFLIIRLELFALDPRPSLSAPKVGVVVRTFGAEPGRPLIG